MFARITSELCLNRTAYRIDGQLSLIGEVRHTLGVLRNKMVVHCSVGSLELMQTSKVLKFINCFPLFNLQNFTPYYLYLNGKLLGKAKPVFFHPRYKITIEGGSNYFLNQHQCEYSSLMCDNNQIALFQKENISVNEQRNYYVQYNKCDEFGEAFLLLCCMLMDTEWHKNHRELSSLRYEKTLVRMQDVSQDRINWRPKE